MSLPLDWRADPIVTIEQDLVPVLVAAPTLLCKIAMGKREDDKIAIWQSAAEEIRGLLLTSFDERLVPAGFPLSNGDRTVCSRAGRALGDFICAMRKLKDGDNLGTTRALYHFETGVMPKTEAAINAARRVFISGVLSRQAEHAVAVHAVLQEVETISRRIDNAALSAARVSSRDDGLIAARK